MADLQRVEGQTELKCEAEKFFEVWARKSQLVSKICPDKYPNIELNEGDSWDQVGAVQTWHYVINDIGERAFVKIRIEEFDEENRFVRYSYHDGLIVRNYYKSLKSKIQATPEGEGCLVKWSMEYEKLNEDAPEPSMYIDYLLTVARDIDAYLCNA